jgi:hypothetical protein
MLCVRMKRVTALLELESVAPGLWPFGQRPELATFTSYLRDLPKMKHSWSRIEARRPNNELKCWSSLGNIVFGIKKHLLQ